MLGANDGLVSVASLILGVGAGTTDLKVLALSGCSALVAGKYHCQFVSFSKLSDCITAAMSLLSSRTPVCSILS